MSQITPFPGLSLDDDFFNQFKELLDDATSHTTPQSLSDASYYIGLMSGTSLDGLDAVLCQFYEVNADNDEPVEILATASALFPDELHAALLALCQPNGVAAFIESSPVNFESELDVFGWASVQYAEFAADLVNQLLAQSETIPDEVVAIGCHGQTVRHRPAWRFSLQLVDPNVLAERTQIAVVSDFRRRDMAVGGQGAPLVPAFHQAMFAGVTQQHAKNAPTVILNLGGIANITVLPPESNHDQSALPVIGFDTGPANLLLDAWCQRHTGQAFDQDGMWAKSGQVNTTLLAQLKQHPFFAKPYPKSTGREAFNLAWVEQVLASLTSIEPTLTIKPNDVQATLTELTAISVAEAIKDYIQQVNLPAGDVYVCGGGVYNKFLMARLGEHLAQWRVMTTEQVGIEPRWVEAVAFAWLAQQTLLNQPANLPSVTGADKAVVLGQVCF